MEEIKGLTAEKLQGMIRLQNQYYRMMEVRRQEQAREQAREAKNVFIAIAIIALLVAPFLLWFDREPPMYVEAADGTLSINYDYLIYVQRKQNEAAADYYEESSEHYEEEYYDEEQY